MVRVRKRDMKGYVRELLRAIELQEGSLHRRSTQHIYFSVDASEIGKIGLS
jgi:hypothetical protein